MEENRNPRPIEATSKLPTITLFVLIAMVIALLFVGWQSVKDDGAKEDDLVSKRPSSADISGQNGSQAVVIPPPYEETGNDNVVKDEKEKKVESKKIETNKEEKPKIETKKVELPKGQTISHTVQSGETFFGIANRYNLSKSALQALNPGVEPDGIKVGVTKLTVKVRTIHTVGFGDVLRVVAQKYGISKQALMDANKKTKDISERGEKLIIPLK